MITLRQIQFALAVARHRHFKRAAEECNVSQSALSLGVAEMEKILGVVMFERGNKQVVITPIGEELLTRAQQIYLDAQQLLERAHAGQGDLNYGMNMGFIPTVAPYLLPSLFPLLKQQHPDFKLNLREDLSDRLIQAVQNGVLDAAVIALPYKVSGLEIMPFGRERFYVLAHRNRPLRQPSMRIDDLQQLPLLLLSEGHCLKDHIAQICQLEQDSQEEAYRHVSLHTLMHMVLNDMGVTLIPKMSLSALKNEQDIHLLPLEQEDAERHLVLITRPNYPRLPELKRLQLLLTEALHRVHAEADALWEERYARA